MEKVNLIKKKSFDFSLRPHKIVSKKISPHSPSRNFYIAKKDTNRQTHRPTKGRVLDLF